jgi:hypothetical protein
MQPHEIVICLDPADVLGGDEEGAIAASDEQA